MRKAFIVARSRPDIYASLCRALASEPEVFVIYDRRSGDAGHRERRRWRSLWSAPELASEGGDRRRRTDVDEEIQERGFGVVYVYDNADMEDPSEPARYREDRGSADGEDDDDYYDDREDDR